MTIDWDYSARGGRDTSIGSAFELVTPTDSLGIHFVLIINANGGACAALLADKLTICIVRMTR